MKGYSIEDFSDERTYFAFIHYMLARSDFFSNCRIGGQNDTYG